MLDRRGFMRQNLRMQLDPFSDLLKLLNAHSVLAGGLITGGSWAIRFPASDQIKFWGIVRGSCSLVMAGETTPIPVEAGDVFLLRTPRSHVLASDLSARLVELQDVLADRKGAVVEYGEGDEFFMIGGKVELSGNSGQLLLDELPSLIHIRAASRHSTSLRWLLEQLVKEQDDHHPGVAAASSQLAHLMFIQILRACFESSEPLASGRLRAIGDRRLAPALQLMHGDPGRAWQLDELAKAAAMSRATFSSHFKTVAGVAPITYLTEWRMRLAERILRSERTSVSALAASLGYASESAFSNAFKRVTGRSPKTYRKATIARDTSG
ncbi:AraC family transcriptional regulator [Herbaspirillum rhizosphaerae]|uniref:AraC family transcriptional regulator n=1 Tax=Herbaspirillum rhizosphaerae TaxID=346179 RepID=UPI000A7D5638|nr:AraC family transcriptional regulator [Herbaspirillum rhizosphaerae]